LHSLLCVLLTDSSFLDDYVNEFFHSFKIALLTRARAQHLAKI
jgi:hypothetical protein